MLNSMEKRTGVLLLIFSLIIFLVAGIFWMLYDPDALIAFHMPNGHVIFYKRGLNESILFHSLALALFALPMLALAIILLSGYGGKIWKWLKYGRQPEENHKEEKND